MDINKLAETKPWLQKLPTKATWKDLVLPSDHIESLQKFMLSVACWKASEGPTALFSGPADTGKTFAAEILAKELGWPLYRVDLDMLVSKYIGETKKNLNTLFDAAGEQSVALLFIGADSLFTKRDAIKKANHLLGFIKRHQRLSILTSQSRECIDPALMRRLQLVIEFPCHNSGTT